MKIKIGNQYLFKYKKIKLYNNLKDLILRFCI